MDLAKFRLEDFFERWEFTARFNLTASDAQTTTLGDLLGLGGGAAREEFERLALSYRLRSMLRPATRVVAVNFPNNPTGFAPDPDTFAELVELCDGRGIRLLSDEVYRGIELDPAATLPQAADLSPTAVSLNVMSKAYGLPGLRVGWVACRDRELLERLLQGKYYTSICNAGPSEFLATVALRNRDEVLGRTREVVAANRVVFDGFFAEFTAFFDWTPPVGGCVAFPRYRGPGDVEEFCQELVQTRGVLLMPASVVASDLAEVPTDRFRIGIGRRDPEPALAQLAEFLGAGQR